MLKELGSGCFGTVYKAKYKGEIIAAKKLNVTSRNMNDIIAEIIQLSKLDHQNIVRFIDFSTILDMSQGMPKSRGSKAFGNGQTQRKNKVT